MRCLLYSKLGIRTQFVMKSIIYDFSRFKNIVFYESSDTMAPPSAASKKMQCNAIHFIIINGFYGSRFLWHCWKIRIESIVEFMRMLLPCKYKSPLFGVFAGGWNSGSYCFIQNAICWRPAPCRYLPPSYRLIPPIHCPSAGLFRILVSNYGSSSLWQWSIYMTRAWLFVAGIFKSAQDEKIFQ